MELYHAPQLVVEPLIKRGKTGLVSLEIPEKGPEVYFSLNGSDPTIRSRKYKEPFEVKPHTEIRAIAHDPNTGRSSSIVSKTFDISKTNWEVTRASSGDQSKVGTIIDEDPATWWGSAENRRMPQEVIIDLGELKKLKGFTYLPIQARYLQGIITEYEIYLSKTGRNWGYPIKKGEFSNILNSPIEQQVLFNAPREAQYIRFRAMKSIDNRMGIAEFGVLTE